MPSNEKKDDPKDAKRETVRQVLVDLLSDGGPDDFWAGSIKPQPGEVTTAGEARAYREAVEPIAAHPDLPPGAEPPEYAAMREGRGGPWRSGARLPEGGPDGAPPESLARPPFESPYAGMSLPPNLRELTPADAAPSAEAPAAPSVGGTDSGAGAPPPGAPVDEMGDLLQRTRQSEKASHAAAQELADDLDPYKEGSLANEALKIQYKKSQLNQDIAGIEATYATNMANLQAETTAQQNELAISQQRAREEAWGHYQDAQREFDEISRRGVGPNPMFIAAQAITQIGNAIGMGMGAAAGILAGTGGNPVAPVAQMNMRVIDRMIDRDIRAQELAIRNAGSRVGVAQSALARLREKMGDERTALAALRASMYDQAAKQVEAAKAQYQAPMQQVLGDELMNQLMMRSAKAKEEMLQSKAQTSMKAISTEASIRTARMQAQKAAADRAMQVWAAKIKAAQQLPGKPVPPPLAMKLGDVHAQLTGIEKLKTEFKRLRPTAGVEQLLPGDAQEYAHRAEVFRENLLRALSGAAVSVQEAERIAALIPGPGTFADSGVSRLDALHSELERLLKTRLVFLQAAGLDTQNMRTIAATPTRPAIADKPNAKVRGP